MIDACGKAVSMEPENGGFRDSRGLARALTGDFKGAVDDFKYYVKWARENNRPENFIKKREDWIQKLEKGQNPFDQAELTALRNE
jgi:hypothetical protein